MYNSYDQRTGGGRGVNRTGAYQSGNNTNYQNRGNAMMAQDYLPDSNEESTQPPQSVQQPTPQASREPQYMGAYTLIPPNESRRNAIQRTANQGLEAWDRFKEAQRPGPINLTPEKVGGYVPETEVRQKQQQMQAQAKYQKMLQREEHKKKEKAKEDAKIQRMKDIQRQKAENLKEKQKQQEQTRQIQWQDDRYLRNNAFLDHVSQQYDSYPVYDEHEAHSSVWARRESYRQQQKQEEEMKLQAMKAEQRQKSEMLEFEQRQKEENARQRHHENHKRVNNAFLDRLEQRNTANTSQNKYCGVKNEWN
uniref:Epithelial stromal interaction 1 n=1 Tax=Leptobrachium leishanense TaxID=445787 RepID=A0A8C5Q0T5_9ANUR